jgi:hypothetical protein
VVHPLNSRSGYRGQVKVDQRTSHKNHIAL